MAKDGRDETIQTDPAADQQFGTLRQKIDALGYSEKLQLALTGSWSERSILIRDKNKTIAASVLKSPQMAEQELAAIAQMRDVDEDILREIGTNRQWVKSYTVVINLVSNPKTPIAIALNLLPRLPARDLKLLKLNKNISEAVSKKAGRYLAARLGGQKASRR
jgi:hypothetical protein